MDRLRWDNIARAAALLGLIALVVAWPHLRRHGPSLPSAAATPVRVEAPGVVARPKVARPRVVRRIRHAPVRRRRIKPVRRVGHRGERHVASPAPPSPAPPPPAPRPAPPPADDQAAREFVIP